MSSMPSMRSCAPWFAARAVQRSSERGIEDVVDERRLPDPLTPVTAVSTPSGIRTSMFFRLFARGAADDEIALQLRPARRRRGDLARAGQVGAGHRLAGLAAASHQRLRRPLKNDVPAVLAGARAEVDHVVRRANRLLVVLDDDDGVAQIAKPGESVASSLRLSRWWSPIDGSSST